MYKVYYNKDGWICNLYPYNIEIDDENHFLELDEEQYSQILSSSHHYAWRYINGELVNEQYEEIPSEEEIDRLRLLREQECFPIINRGQLWYDTLSDEQVQELNEWYRAWLDITITKVIPEKPNWLE